MPLAPFYLQIVDSAGQVIKTSSEAKDASLVDLFVQRILPKGVGLFRTEAHVEQDIRDGITEVIKKLRVELTTLPTQECPMCGKTVSIWHTYADGSFTCTDCHK